MVKMDWLTEKRMTILVMIVCTLESVITLAFEGWLPVWSPLMLIFNGLILIFGAKHLRDCD